MMQFSVTTFCPKCRLTFLRFKLQQLQGLRLNSTTSTDTTQENLNVLKKLGLAEDEAQRLHKKMFSSLKKPPNLKATVDCLQGLGFSSKQIIDYYVIMKRTPKIIENRFRVLKEGGFYRVKIKLPVLKHFFTFTSRSVEDLKRDRFIGKDTVVTRCILRYSDFPPQHFPTEEDQSLSFERIHETAIKTYMHWKYDVSEEFLEKALKTTQTPMWSITLINECHSFLTNTLGLTNEQIVKNVYLLYHRAEDYLNTLGKVPSVGTLPLLTIAKQNPKILKAPADTLLEKVEALKELGLPLESALANSDILLLSTATIKERMMSLRNNPDLQPYLHNPQVLKAIIFYNNMKRRYKILNNINWRCQSLNLLSVRSKVFQSRLKTGHDYAFGQDLLYFLEREVGMDRRTLRAALKHNPVWNMVPPSTLTGNLQLLRAQGFTDSQITRAITVLLYPNSEVKKCLDEMDSRPEVDCCRDQHTKKVKTDLILQLVLYYLERPCHFNGNGIFTNQPLLNLDLVANLNFDPE